MLDALGFQGSGAAVGGAGVATANLTGTQALTGMLLGFFVKYNDAPPATTDVTIEAIGGPLPTRTLLVLTDKNADGYFPTVRQALDPTGASAAGWFAGQPLVQDKIKVTIAGANAGDSVSVYPVIER